MPQIEQIQTVWWGPLRPDPIDLAVDGVNVITGLNGVGKTCLLDAGKLMLGIDQLKAKPSEYIFSGSNGDQRADRAYIKVVFANRDRPGRTGRVFADVGYGCEQAAHVTAICEVSRHGRRYTVVPGYRAWDGASGRIEDHLAELKDIPAGRWYRPRQWSELLLRAGVSRALLGVIALKQGETDRALRASPEQLLREMLELTGKQSTLDRFRAAKTKLGETRGKYDDALKRFESEERHLKHVNQLAARHREYEEDSRRLGQIDDLELPAAHHRERRAGFERLTSERDQRVEQLERARQEVAQLDQEIPALENREAAMSEEQRGLQGQRKQAQEALGRAAAALGGAETNVQQAREAIAAAEAFGRLEEAQRAEAEQAASEAAHHLMEARAERERLDSELAELRAGRPLPPPDLIEFRATLESRGIVATLLSEQLEVEPDLPAEAALAERVWTLVVAPAHFEETVALAREAEYRLPVARSGSGKPAGVLADASGLDEALAFLAEVDMPLGARGVSTEGLVRGDTWAHYRAPERPALGQRARERMIAAHERRLGELKRELLELEAEAEKLARASHAIAAGLEAKAALPSLEAKLGELEELSREAEGRLQEVDRSLDRLGPRLGQASSDLVNKRSQRETEAGKVRDLTPRVERESARVREHERQLSEAALTEEQAALEAVASVEVLESERESLRGRLERFSDEERSPEVLATQQEQKERVDETRELLGQRREDLQEVESQVERARQSYEEHIRQTINLLRAAFREICPQAGMEGDIELRPSATQEGEHALDVRVAHIAGEEKLSYQHHKHSGGQRAKISILLLLAAMSTEGPADLLIIDEHSAHLDSENIDYVGEVMRKLRGRVQFILALPSNAEARRLDWCDHQLALLPRGAGEAFAPPVRLLTRMPGDGDRYAEMDQLELAR